MPTKYELDRMRVLMLNLTDEHDTAEVDELSVLLTKYPQIKLLLQCMNAEVAEIIYDC